MTFRTADKNAKIVCSHCGAEQEDHIGDYVVHGRVGRASRSTEICHKCDAEFSVEFDGKEYVVEDTGYRSQSGIVE